jgi:exodeoxyribonuclease V gamma subunit
MCDHNRYHRSMSELIVHRDSRTEVLAAQLAAALERSRQPNPLAAQTVVVAHLGLRRWLLGEFASRGRRGIAANFDMILPWQWLERTAHVLLGDEALVDGDWRSEALRWRIYAALPALGSATLHAYLRGRKDAERRRFQLADHLAAVFAQYLIYRPDWIVAWEQGGGGDDWQAQLWRLLRRSIAAPHRVQPRDALLAKLAQHGDGEKLPLHVFGVSHLAPDILDALHALAGHRLVHLYFPDPCRHYWADLQTPRALLKLQPESEELYFDVGHPLLVSLGRMAQDFFIGLDARGVDLGGDEYEPIAPRNLLQAVQASVRECAPVLAGEPPARADDASLRVHACHTRLRELEVLRDALLGFLADSECSSDVLQHRDIVVMAPNISAYAPYLPAVFGAPATYADDRAHIPWHLADVGLASQHPLLAAFARALDLSDSRFAVSEVMDFLDVPAVARRFGIDVPARAAIDHRLRSARVAWGLDAAMKESVGAAAVAQNSWAFGFDRLFAGLIAGDDTSDELLDGIWPVPRMSGSDGEAIGRLQCLVDTLSGIRDGFAVSRELTQWCDWLIERLDALFDVRDEHETAAFESLRSVLIRLGDQAGAAGSAALPWSVMRQAVHAELDKVSERQLFLLGGVTFCGLVPQRSIPFRVVCLLGMNEGEFPRRGGDVGLNRMLTAPRRGDRDTRREDRYLFLEALMAAREHLHISYVGEGVQDGKPRNPASPLAELLQFLDAQQRPVGQARPWLVRHPLQPSDARYFDATDPRLFTFDRSFLDASPRASAAAFIDVERLSAHAPVAAREVSLSWLKRFWRDPAKARLRDEAGLSLDALDVESWPDREPLTTGSDRRERVEQRLLQQALTTGTDELPATAPDWLARSGVLAAGAAGERAYAQARERTQAVLDAARKRLGARLEPCVHAVDLDLGDGTRLLGRVQAWRNESGTCVFAAKPNGEAKLNELLPFYIDYAAARLDSGATAFFVEYVKKNKSPVRVPKLFDAIVEQSEHQLRGGLRRLVDLAVGKVLLFPPYTAWEWLNASPATRAANARRRWEGVEFSPVGGERDFSAYAALIARDADFLDEASAAHTRFADTASIVAAVLDPRRHALLKGAQ